MQKISLAIHGGAGTILKEDMTPELEQAYLQGLQSALAELAAATNVDSCVTCQFVQAGSLCSASIRTEL